MRSFQRYSHTVTNAKKITLPKLHEMAQNSQKIAMVTAHDSLSARMAEEAGVDIVLVGDSLAMVSMGFPDTSQITLDEMIYHCKAVKRGCQAPFIIGDLPFGSYEQSVEKGVESTVRMIKEGGADCVKFEGGRELAPMVERLSQYGIATMPHIGLTPQRQVATGGFKVQGRKAESAFRLLEDALVLESAGAQLFLLEGVPTEIGEVISSKVKIPVIGIGAGAGTSGQVLVQLDMLGGFDDFKPKFLKRYADLLGYSTSAIKQYVQEVRQNEFPQREHSYSMKEEEFIKFTKLAERV